MRDDPFEVLGDHLTLILRLLADNAEATGRTLTEVLRTIAES